MNEYTIHGGDAGKKRLEILSGTIAPGTEGFLTAAGLTPGLHCLDLGCGAGHVTLLMAERVGSSGRVAGLDVDERKIQLASEAAASKGIKNVRFQMYNAYDLQDDSAYDLVYSRFLLSHLGDPRAVLRNIGRALKPGGRLLIEDTHFSGHFSYPLNRAFNRYVSLYRRLLNKRGADADIGPKLMGMLGAAGFVGVEYQIVQPAFSAGAGKLMAEITFEGISKALQDEGLIQAAELERIYKGLVKFRQREDTVMSLPRIFQVRARKL